MMAPEFVGAGGNGRKPRRPPPQPKRKTAEFRRWTTINLTDARTDIEDTELFWCENAIAIGKGTLQTLQGPGDPIVTLMQGIASLWGFTLNGTPIAIAVGSDGSLTQVAIPSGALTAIAGPGAVSTMAHLTMWQGSTVLIEDPVAGYSSWTGAVYTVINAALVGQAIAVFEGRVWLANGRTITFTAPNSFTDLTVGNGAGTVVITDEAFVGNIVHMISLVEQLWIFGPAAIETINNVTASGTAPNVLTTFAITNIVSGLGSASANSGIGYFRAVGFMSPGGIYAISGVTPQQLSEKLDQMFPALTLLPDTPAANVLVHNLNAIIFLVTYTQSLVPELPTSATEASTPTPLVIGFTKGKTFFASQGATLHWITTVYVNGTPQAWGSDTEGRIFQLFGAPNTQALRGKIVGKLHPMGKAVQMKALMKIGVELQANGAITPTLTIDSEMGSRVINLAPTSALNLLNNLGQPLLLQNSSGQTLTLIGQGGLALPKQDAAMFGHYLGWTYRFNDPPHRLQAIQMEYSDTRDWNP